MNINKYLEAIQSDENVSAAAGIGFAIDGATSDKKKKKKEIIKTSYPNESVKHTLVKRAMIDLDRTIHKYTKSWDDGTLYDDPFPGAKKVIEWLKSIGYEIVIFTTRASEENAKEHGQDLREQIEIIENWLKLHDIYYDRITAEKLNADFYIDDKAIHINNGNWVEVLKNIKQRINL